MELTKFLDRTELVLAGSFLTLVAIWFSGDTQYDWAGYVLMALFFAIKGCKAALSSKAESSANT